jgi:hypothetical protein
VRNLTTSNEIGAVVSKVKRFRVMMWIRDFSFSYPQINQILIASIQKIHRLDMLGFPAKEWS